MLLKLKKASLTYLKATPFEVQALDNVDFSMRHKEAVGIIGTIGSGKSTLGQVLSGLLKFDSGTLIIKGKEVGKEISQNQIYKDIAFLFQKPEKQLFEANVYSEVAFGPRNMGLSEKKVDEAVKKALTVVSMSFERYKDRSPFSLSGGEMRRLGIASVLALESEGLIMDEPTAGLDFDGKKRIIKFLNEYKREHSIALISHDLDEILRVCERFVVLDKGRIVLESTTGDVLKHTSFLNKLGLFVPQEYILAKKLIDCGYNVKKFDRGSIKKAIKEKING